MQIDSSKACRACGQSKALSDFRKGRVCRDCERERNRTYRQRKPEKAREAGRHYRQANRQELAAKARRWREANPDYNAEWFRRNPGMRSKYWRAYEALRLNAPGDGATLSELISEHGPLCYLCGTAEAITVEHMIPLSRGGSNERENLRPACKSCNSSKRAMTVEEYLDAKQCAS